MPQHSIRKDIEVTAIWPIIIMAVVPRCISFILVVALTFVCRETFGQNTLFVGSWQEDYTLRRNVQEFLKVRGK